jgi:hypothetical protein
MAKAKTAAEATETNIAIKPPQFKTLAFTVTGTAPLVQHAFWKKGEMQAGQEAGGTSKSRKKRDARDFSKECKDAGHYSEEGWRGHPASAFRNACIDACRLVGYKMTMAKMSLWVEPDGLDAVDGSPLVKLVADEPEETILSVRNANGGTDLRARPMFRRWSIKLRVRYDADQFTDADIANLMERAGAQCGIGEGRPFSKNSYGMGWGTFTVKG